MNEEEEQVYLTGDRVIAANRSGTITGKNGKFYCVTYDEPVFLSEVFVMHSPAGKESEGGLIYGGEFFWFSLTPL